MFIIEDLNLFLGAVKYNDIIERYKNNNNDTLSANDHAFAAHNYIHNKKRPIYWTVTEDGFSYCSSNCLKFQKNKSNFQPYSAYPAVTNSPVDYKKRLTEFFKADLFGNAFNHTFRLIETLDSNFYWEYPVKATRLARQKDGTEESLAGRLEQLKCIPYANETQYDFLRGVKWRRKLKGVPEPEVLAIFDRTGKVQMSALRARLIKMKKEVNV